MSSIVFSVGSFEVRWYSVILLVAFIISMFVIKKETKRFVISGDFVFNMLFWALIFGIIGARLYYVIFEWNYYSNNLGEILKIWNGGLAIHYWWIVSYCCIR